MAKMIINENERGLLFRDGRLHGLLLPGKYSVGAGIFGKTEIEVLRVDDEILPEKCRLNELALNSSARGSLQLVKVPDGHAALHFVDGNFRDFITAGRHAFFKEAGEHSFKIVDFDEPELSDEVAKYAELLPDSYLTTIEVGEHELARLLYNNKPIRTLKPGVYRFWSAPTRVSAVKADLRPTQECVSGQELLTLDKISIRVTLVYNSQIVDFDKSIDAGDLRGRLYSAAQLALREYVGGKTLDEILADRDGTARFVGEKLASAGEELGVKISATGVKDIIIPGEIRAIMNEVLLAEKRAEANVITRREEVASTRSLLNTAKLMDENKTLYRLKELEYLTKICEQVGGITLNGQGDVIAQLSALLSRKEPS